MALLISPADLSALLDEGAPVRLLDVRWRLDRPEGRPDYVAGHLPGAVYVDLERELSRRGEPEEGRHPLPETADLQRAARRWGISRGDVVVVYDDIDSVAAARAWWLLTRSGVADVRVLELESLMSGRGGLLTLTQALDAFPDLHWNLDVKAASAALPVGRAVAKDGARVLITSFSDARRREALAAAARSDALPPATSAGRGTITRLLGAVASGSSALVARVLSGIDAVQIPERHAGVAILTDRLLRLTAAAGVEVHVWTVNDTTAMQDLVRRGVHGIVTDRADEALRTLDAPG